MDYKVLELPTSEVYIDHSFNCRGPVVPIDVIDLAEDIKLNGLATPITVQPWTRPDLPKIKYRVIAGHRRATAIIKLLKLPTIAAFVKEYVNEVQAKTDSLRENLHRKDLNIKQEAHALKVYLDQFYPIEEIAKLLNQSRGWVDIRLKLLNLCDRVQDYAAAGLITQEHIKCLQGKTETQQLEFVREVKEHKERGDTLVLEKPKPKKSAHQKYQPNKEEIFEVISHFFDTGYSMGFWSRCLAWSAGQISKYELLKEFREECHKEGINYEIPDEILLERMV